MANLADYIAEAQRAPFVLDLADGTSITIPQPTWEVAAAAEEDAESVMDVLRALAGDQGDALAAALAGVPASIPAKLRADMYAHWGMGNAQASPSS